MSLESREAECINGLLAIPDVHERLAEVVRRGGRHRLSEAVKADTATVPGCISRVWLVMEKDDDSPPRLTFRCDADSPMVKGLAALLCDLYSGAPKTEVLAFEPRIWDACGFAKMLSPTRLNGLAALQQYILKLTLNDGSNADH